MTTLGNNSKKYHQQDSDEDDSQDEGKAKGFTETSSFY